MKTVQIAYFVHGTAADNESRIAAGHAQGELSELGKRQSVELKGQIKGKRFDAVLCSDLKRAVDSAELAFGGEAPIICDKRLRECGYGDITKEDSRKVEAMTLNCIEYPFPNGESYKDVEKRMRDFLKGLLEKYEGKSIAIAAHRAPRLALDVIIRGRRWKQAADEDWRLKKPKEWKPGRDYGAADAHL